MNRSKLILIGGILIATIIGIALVISLTRGGSDSGDTGSGGDIGGSSSSGEQITLEYWGLWEPDGVMQPIIAEYERANPNVKIIYTQKSFTQYEQNLYTRLKEAETGSPAPDIVRIHNSWLNKFQDQLAPIPQDIMTPSEYTQTFYPTAAVDFTGTDNAIYAIPLEIDGIGLFYNKEIFAAAGVTEPPQDWESIFDLAKSLTVTDSDGTIIRAGIAAGGGSNIAHSADILSLLLLQSGVEINQNFNTEVSLTSDRAVEALDFYADFIETHQVWSTDLRKDLELFYSGEVAMMFAPSWRAFDVISANPSIEFGIAPTPVLGGEELYYSTYWAEAVSKHSENTTEAWKFLKYLSEPQQLRAFHGNSIEVAGRAFGEPYSRQDMASDLASHKYLGAYIEMAPNMTSWKMGEETFIKQELIQAVDKRLGNSNVRSEQVLGEAEAAINLKLGELFAE